VTLVAALTVEEEIVVAVIQEVVMAVATKLFLLVIIATASIGIALVLALGITATVQPVFAPGGNCAACARSFAPGILGDPTESAPGHHYPR
jgi:hypothetical protein